MAKWNAPLTPVNASAAALDWALKHVEEFGDTVFLPRAFEYEAIRSNWSKLQAWLTSQDLREWKARPLRRFLARKTAYSFRFVTQLDPLEYLLFTALSMRSDHNLKLCAAHLRRTPCLAGVLTLN